MLTYGAQNLSAECSDLRASLQSASEKASFHASATERAQDENNLLRKEVEQVTRFFSLWEELSEGEELSDGRDTGDRYIRGTYANVSSH